MPWLFSSEVKKDVVMLICLYICLLFPVGIIDTNPGKFKEGRFFSTNSGKNGIGSSSKLLEVENPNAPNILTNDPDFFNDDFPPKNAGLYHQPKRGRRFKCIVRIYVSKQRRSWEMMKKIWF